MVAYYEDGAYVPPIETITALADVLGVPETFFAADDIATIPADTASFRALSKMSAARRDAALSIGALASELNRWLEAHLHLPAPGIPRYERVSADPVGAVPRLRFEWELGYAPILNVLHLASATVVCGLIRTAFRFPKSSVYVVGSHPSGGPNGLGRSPTQAVPVAVKTLTDNGERERPADMLISIS